MFRLRVGFLLFVLWGAVSSAMGGVRVTVSILPVAHFVERVGGDRVEVGVLVRPGESPATYQPTPRQMADLARSSIYFRVGVPFEGAFVPRIESSLPRVRIVDLRKGVELRRMREGHTHESHDHGHESHDGAKHEPEGMDPHIWLDPQRVKIMSGAIRDALSKADPEGADLYSRNLKAWWEELDALDRSLSQVLAPLKGRKLFVFHPSYGYFADRYGLVQEAIEIGGKSPSPRQIARIVSSARRDRVRVIFVQPQFDRRAARSIAGSIGGAVVAIDPLARDYVKNLEGIARAIRDALDRDKGALR